MMTRLMEVPVRDIVMEAIEVLPAKLNPACRASPT
jgi:hypothetical protein